QTWYEKKSISQADPEPQVDEQELIRLLGFLPSGEKNQESKISEAKASQCKYNEKLPCRANPSTILQGFFAPFPGYSSSVASARYDPENLSTDVSIINVFSQKKETAVTFVNDDLRNKVNQIVNSFIEDIHSQGLGLIVLDLESRSFKRLYYTKK